MDVRGRLASTFLACTPTLRRRRASKGVAYREARLSRAVCCAWRAVPLRTWKRVTPQQAADGDADENGFWVSAVARWPGLDVRARKE